jgi:hypothetical protein
MFYKSLVKKISRNRKTESVKGGNGEWESQIKESIKGGIGEWEKK